MAGRFDGCVFVWQVEDLSADQFADLREEARQELSRAEQRAKAKKVQTDVTVEAWQVVLVPADDELLAKNGLLRGKVVSRILADSSPAGLQAGDIIIDYYSVYDMVMGQFVPFRPSNRWARIVKYGGTLDVLRGDQLLSLKIKSRGAGL